MSQARTKGGGWMTWRAAMGTRSASCILYCLKCLIFFMWPDTIRRFHLGAWHKGRRPDDMAPRDGHQVLRMHRPQRQPHQHLRGQRLHELQQSENQNNQVARRAATAIRSAR